MGHVVRCLALADHLKENHGCNINFAMRQSELGMKTVKESYKVFDLNKDSFNYCKSLLDCIYISKSNIFIMDMRDGLTREELKFIKKRPVLRLLP